MEIKVENISPEIAREYLKHNVENRKLRKTRIEEYAETMGSGKWKQNGVPIIFDDEGMLRDGQHRLEAIIAANKTLENVIVITVPESESNFYDCGLARSVGDIIKFDGDKKMQEINNTTIASVAGFFARSVRKNGSAYKSQTIEIMRNNYELFSWLKSITNGAKNVRGIKSAGVLAAIAAAYNSGYPLEKLERFFAVLLSGLIENENESPIVRLRDWLIFNNQNRMGGNVAQKTSYLRTQYALFCYEKNNSKGKCKEATQEYYSFWRMNNGDEDL